MRFVSMGPKRNTRESPSRVLFSAAESFPAVLRALVGGDYPDSSVMSSIPAALHLAKPPGDLKPGARA
jgi:hypothetical protein